MKVALITGGTDGIGQATALALAKQNYTLHIIGRNANKGALNFRETSSH